MLPTPPAPVPLAIAATEPRGMHLVAQYGEWWITFGDFLRAGDLSDEECLAAVAAQAALLDAACAAAGRRPASVRRLLLTGSTREPWLDSVDSFLTLVHRYAAIGITDVVIHAPRAEPPHVADPLVFDHIIGLLA